MPGEPDLQTLLDEREIRRLVAAYSDAVGRRDESAWAATWTDDAVWDVGLARAAGRTEVVKTWNGLMDRFRSVVQLPQHGTVQVDGDAGSGEWHVLELGFPREGAGVLTIGHYRDDYRRTADGWRFAKRVFRVLYTGPPDLSGRVFGHPDAPL